MNVRTCYGAYEIVMVGSTPTVGLVWLSYYTFEKLDQKRKLDAEIIAGRLLAWCRR